MAAQAVDFTVSGHVARALVITNSDGGTKAQEKDSGSTGSRIRVVGSGEAMAGVTAGVTLEYGAGGNGGSAMSLRYADLNFGGEFGKISIGHGDDAGEGSVYSDKSGVLGIGHGQDKGGASTLGDYFGSLDGGGARGNRIRYDTPAVGPISAAISVGNGDEVSAGVKLSQSFGDTAFGAKVGTTMSKGNTGTVSASAGIKLPAGVTFSGAWGQGDNHTMGKKDGAIDCAMADMASASACAVTAAVAGNVVDPSFFQATVGYVLGDTSVAASWYASSDMMNDGSEGTAIGVGVNHNLPKVDANVFVAAQNYAVDDMAGGVDTDQTVVMIGTRIKF